MQLWPGRAVCGPDDANNITTTRATSTQTGTRTTSIMTTTTTPAINYLASVRTLPRRVLSHASHSQFTDPARLVAPELLTPWITALNKNSLPTQQFIHPVFVCSAFHNSSGDVPDPQPLTDASHA